MTEKKASKKDKKVSKKKVTEEPVIASADAPVKAEVRITTKTKRAKAADAADTPAAEKPSKKAKQTNTSTIETADGDAAPTSAKAIGKAEKKSGKKRKRDAQTDPDQAVSLPTEQASPEIKPKKKKQKKDKDQTGGNTQDTAAEAQPPEQVAVPANDVSPAVKSITGEKQKKGKSKKSEKQAVKQIDAEKEDPLAAVPQALEAPEAHKATSPKLVHPEGKGKGKKAKKAKKAELTTKAKQVVSDPVVQAIALEAAEDAGKTAAALEAEIAADGGDATLVSPATTRGGTAAKAFQRVKAEEWLNKKAAKDNSYGGTFGSSGWGAKAEEVLGKVRGKDFRHEKTKKKRGSYRGGLIDDNVNSFKFESDEE